MTINLDNLFHYGNRAQAIENVEMQGMPTKEILDLAKLMPGDTLRGTIVSMDSEGISLLLAEGQIIKASVQESGNMSVGQSILFSVAGNSGSKVSLSPLFFNREQGLTAQKALDSAGIPKNDRNLAFVSSMMEEGMPIDRESLLQRYPIIQQYKGEPVKNLVQMMQIGMPVTKENVEQFSRYKSLEHQLIKSFDSVMEQLPEIFAQLRESQGNDRAVAFYREVLDQFVPHEMENIVPDDPVILKAPYMVLDETIEMKQEQDVAGAEHTQNKPVQGEVFRENETPLENVLSKTEIQELVNRLPLPDARGIAELTVQETLQMMRQVENPKDLFMLPAFTKLLQSQIDSQWLLSPREIEDGKNVVELYERVRNQTQKLSDALIPYVKEEHAVMKELSNLRNNVDFMHQLNQMFSYVQLPLKMGQFEAHGELYVYTNRKALTGNDGRVSALLHLDMEHLGMMDVYVQLEQEKVSTKFYLPDEATIDFMEKHMDALTDRLKNRGYQMKSEVILKDAAKQEHTVIEELIKENRNIMAVGVGSYSFDYRV